MADETPLAGRSHPGIHLLTLYRPDALNAIDMDRERRLFGVLDTAEADPDAQ